MKVAFIVSRLTNGGTERSCLSVAELLANRGVDTCLIVRENDSPRSFIPSERIRQEFLGSKSKPGIAEKLRRLGSLRTILKRLDPDWVISFNHGYANMLLSGVFFSYKTITSERFYGPAHYSGRRIARFISWLTYRLSTVVVFQTDECRDAYGYHIRKKAVIIPNAISAQLPDYRWSRDNRIIISLARLEPQKNIPLLIDAFALFHESHPDYQLVIYGNGNDYDSLYKKIHDYVLLDAISILPFEDRIHMKMLDASMFISSSDYEGLQNSLIEAMAMGIPCVATDCLGGGARFLIGNNNERGILVPRADVEALSRAMTLIADNDDIAESLSTKGRSIVDILNTETIGDQWMELIQGSLQK